MNRPIPTRRRLTVGTAVVGTAAVGTTAVGIAVVGTSVASPVCVCMQVQWESACLLAVCLVLLDHCFTLVHVRWSSAWV